jgi:hypothetical protein
MQRQSFNRAVKGFADESGSAVLEFVGFGLLLQITLLMISVDLAALQQSQFAAEAVARHSLRSFILTGTPVDLTAREIMTDFLMTAEPKLQMSCLPAGGCENSGSIITLNVTVGRAQAQSSMRNP